MGDQHVDSSHHTFIAMRPQVPIDSLRSHTFVFSLDTLSYLAWPIPYDYVSYVARKTENVLKSMPKEAIRRVRS